MKASGISSIDHSPQVVAEWLNLLAEDLEWSDRGRTYLLLRPTLHAIRDFLGVGEAADLGAQLRLLIRGIYYDGWVPSRVPVHPRGKQAFLDRVAKPFVDPLPQYAEEAATAVFDLLRRKISEGEYAQVATTMRKPLRDLCE